MVAAGAVVTPGFEVPSGFGAFGTPAVRAAGGLAFLEHGVQIYTKLADRYRHEMRRID